MLARIKRFFSKYGSEVYLMKTAKIIDMSIKKDRVHIGRKTYIRGELTVYPHGGEN